MLIYSQGDDCLFSRIRESLYHPACHSLLWIVMGLNADHRLVHGTLYSVLGTSMAIEVFPADPSEVCPLTEAPMTDSPAFVPEALWSQKMRILSCLHEASVGGLMGHFARTGLKCPWCDGGNNFQMHVTCIPPHLRPILKDDYVSSTNRLCISFLCDGHLQYHIGRDILIHLRNDERLQDRSLMHIVAMQLDAFVLLDDVLEDETATLPSQIEDAMCSRAGRCEGDDGRLLHKIAISLKLFDADEDAWEWTIQREQTTRDDCFQDMCAVDLLIVLQWKWLNKSFTYQNKWHRFKICVFTDAQLRVHADIILQVLRLATDAELHTNPPIQSISTKRQEVVAEFIRNVTGCDDLREALREFEDSPIANAFRAVNPPSAGTIDELTLYFQQHHT